MEIFDICTEEGIPTGETIERKMAHKVGACHRTAHIWIVNKDENGYKVLLQKRAYAKDSFPGSYDTSSAGHIQAGDEPLDSAIRELGEELGIFASKEDLNFAGTFRIKYEREFHNTLFKDNEVAFVFIYDKPVNIENLVIQKEELDGVKWFDIYDAHDKCINRPADFCVPTKGLETVMKYLGLIRE